MDLENRIIDTIQEVIDEFKKKPMDFFVEHDFHHFFEKRFRSRMKESEVLLREYSIPGRKRIDFIIKDDECKIGVEFYFQKSSNEGINSLIVDNQTYSIKSSSLSPNDAKKHLAQDILRLHAIKPIKGYFIEFYRIIVDTRVTKKRKDLTNYMARMNEILDFHKELFTGESPKSIQTPLFVLWDGQSSTIRMFDEFNDVKR